MTWIDLTIPIQEGMTTYPKPWHPYVEITKLGRLGIEGRESRKLVLGTHTGTHCDAPRHFVPGGGTVENIPLDRLIGPARVADLTHMPERSPVSVDVLAADLGDDLPSRLLFRFDWDTKLGDNSYYRDHPYLTEEAARWLIDHGVEILGTDSPQLDNPGPVQSDVDSPIHKILLGGGVILLEYLRNLRLLSRQVELIAAPLPIVGGDGAPCRCCARNLQEKVT
jgi:kynurenine formamidase